jgi:uncharacterized membrane protein YphA (DoxX/SURF4 family)
MEFETVIKNLPALLGALLVAILFIQSGLDKVFDWKGNVEWLKGHFSKTFLGPFVPLMLVQITIMELLAGLTSAAAIVYFLVTGSTTMIFCGASVGAIAIVALFFGQRIAKDYPGAAVLVPYFILLIILMHLTNPLLKT